MAVVLFEPHQDDATLFAAFTCLRERPHVVTVFRSVNQAALGITAEERERENLEALEQLGCTSEQWDIPDNDADPDRIRARMRQMAKPTRVWAPWPEETRAHPQHLLVGELARAVFGKRCRYYCTYAYGQDKTRTPRVVEYERAWILAKLRALACHRSQIERGPYRFWMMDLNEYTP